MKDLLFIYLAVMLLVVVSPARCSKDDTDPEKGISGMTLSTDARTGCQYLSRGFGGLTPRMGADGKQVCTPSTVKETP